MDYFVNSKISIP